MAFVSPRLCKSKKYVTVAARMLTANEAAVALRPFYFLVHPDRFARLPEVRQQNEKSLQIFNGYLNDLFPQQPLISSEKPIEVCFSILNKDRNEIEDVKLSLSGTDPARIVTHALERCRLDTTTVLKSVSSRPRPAFDKSTMPHSTAMENLMSLYLRRKKKQPPSNDISAVLLKGRKDAIKKSKNYEITKMTLKDDIDDLKYRAGVRDVVWQMDWAEAHMKRCVNNVIRLLDNPQSQEVIHSALYKTVLRFGRGSFVCCDGSMQFGADQVPEQWQQTCEEASVRRAQLPTLHSYSAALRELFGGATILTPYNRGLAQTVQQFHNLIVRIKIREPEVQKSLRESGANNMIEVMTSYDELNVGPDGRLCVPCNVDINRLVEYLQEVSQMARDKNKRMAHVLHEIESEATDCARRICLSGLDWESNLDLSVLLSSIQRLKTASEEIQELLHGLHVRFSANPNVHILSDGKISIPLNWF